MAKRRARSTDQGRQIEIERCRRTRNRRKEQGQLQRPATYSHLETSSSQLPGNSNEATSAGDTQSLRENVGMCIVLSGSALRGFHVVLSDTGERSFSL
jgi:hypothetical protein